jgi:hypothetical protein
MHGGNKVRNLTHFLNEQVAILTPRTSGADLPLVVNVGKLKPFDHAVMVDR